MKIYNFLLTTVFFLFSFSAYSQLKNVTGRVTNSSDGSPLTGATIVVKETQQGTVSDANGKFRIQAQDNSILIVSEVGFITREIPVNGRTEIDISLTLTNKSLQEVVVVGYGTESKKNITGSIVQISSDKIKDMPFSSLDQMVQGKAAGVQVSSQSGTPGGGVTVKIRGTTSFSPNSPASQPLYVVDGVFINTTPLGSSGYGTEQQINNPLADIDPNNIKSISVLKDADATAIYGSRGANGVVIITTKRGAYNQKTHINLNTYFGTSSAWRLPKLANGPQTAELLNEAWINKGHDPSTIPYPNAKSLPTYDPVPQIFRNASTYDINLNVSGGGENTSFYMAGEYFKQDGIMRPQSMDRQTFRFNLDHKINDKLSIGTSNLISRTFRTIVPNDNSFGIMLVGLGSATLYPFYNDDGTYYNGPLGNVVRMIKENDQTNTELRELNNTYLEWKIIPNLTFKSSWSIDYDQSYNRAFNSTVLNGPGSIANGSDQNNWQFTWINEQTLRYNLPINNNNFTFLVGNTIEKTLTKGFGVGVSNYPNDDLKNLSSASQADWWSGGQTESSLSSVFGRIDYSYKEKYLVSLTARGDGSSKFGANHRWGFFPAFGLGWRINKETFMENQKLFSDLKLKASYGVTGSQATISEYAAKGLWGGGYNYLGQPGIAPNQLANPDLKWEQTTQLNVGLEFAILHDRISGELDYYNKLTKGVLLNEPVPNTTGFSTIANNGGEISNKGFEFSVNAEAIKTKLLEWDLNFNISYNKNLIEKLNAPYYEPFSRNFIIFQQGYPVNSFRLWKQLKVDPQTGDAVYKILNPDVPVGSDENRMIVGNSNPKFIGGIGTSLKFQRFDFSGSFSFAWGQSIVNWTRFFLEHGSVRSNASNGKATWGFYANQLNRWQKPGDITDIPKLGGTPEEINNNYGLYSSRLMENGSYTRLRSVVLGYTFPQSALKAINSIRIYVSGTNLLTFTKYTGLDPEIDAGGGKGTVEGVEMFTVPQPRTLQVGLNVNF